VLNEIVAEVLPDGSGAPALPETWDGRVASAHA
jgi:hypothetical protein